VAVPGRRGEVTVVCEIVVGLTEEAEGTAVDEIRVTGVVQSVDGEWAIATTEVETKGVDLPLKGKDHQDISLRAVQWQYIRVPMDVSVAPIPIKLIRAIKGE